MGGGVALMPGVSDPSRLAFGLLSYALCSGLKIVVNVMFWWRSLLYSTTMTAKKVRMMPFLRSRRSRLGIVDKQQ